MRKPAKKPPADGSRMTNFRLEPETIADLDAIAVHYTAEVGIKVNRTGAVRIAARNEHRRIKGEPKK